MLFNSFAYLAFLLAAVFIHYLLPFAVRNVFLWLVSLGFAFSWGWQTGTLLLILQLAVYGIARWIAGQTAERRRKAGVAAAFVLLLGILGYFKYAGFLWESAARLCGAEGKLLTPGVLPVGISFYTFICLGYVMDVYRKKCPAENNFFHFGVFSSFFPQFASGPIGRAPELLPQFRRENHCLPENLETGFRLILWGLFKKVVIADRLAACCGPVFQEPGNYSGCSALVAMYFFTIQIYCDFSGYSDIAIGSAKLFGIELMQNFRQPYFADSIYEFWKRWHISLTGWFRDYLYIPLGGNRVSTVRWLCNIMTVFLVSGLWHGAAWTFVLWGGIHGAAYLLELGIRKRLPQDALWFSPYLKPLRILLTFHIVAAAWVFFRALSLEKALEFFARILFHFGSFNWGISKIPRIIAFGLLAFWIFSELLIALGWSGDYLKKGNSPAWCRLVGYSALLLGIALLGVRSENFIYLQF